MKGKKETKCTVCGKVTKNEIIYAAKTINLSATKYTYDGKVKKLTVTIKDSKGNAIASSNYTVTYPSGRKNVEKYTVKVTSAKTVSKTIKNLKAKKTYYVRIRTYKTVGKTPYYSDWSAKKSVTTK